MLLVERKMCLAKIAGDAGMAWLPLCRALRG